MATSDAEANRVLDDKVSSGLSRWVGLALAHPSVADLNVGTVDEADGTYLTTPRISVSLNGGASWSAATAREIHFLTNISFGAALADFVPESWVLWDAATGGNPTDARRINADNVMTDDVVLLPGTSLAFIYPA